MSRDYQRKRNNKYILPYAAYHQTVWQIRDYYRLKEEAQAILDESPPPPDGQPKAQNLGDETAQKAARREAYLLKARQIEEALLVVPKEYRRGVWSNVTRFDPYPMDADRSTYGRWKSRFVYEVAVRMGII